MYCGCSFLLLLSSWCLITVSFPPGVLWLCALTGLWPSLSLGEQLYWKEELSLLLPLPAITYHTHCGCIWLRPGLCPAPPPAAGHATCCCYVSFTWHAVVLKMKSKLCAFSKFTFIAVFILKCYLVLDFIVNFLTLFSQYGCDVCCWSVFCPSRWPDWVPHCAGGPG